MSTDLEQLAADEFCYLTTFGRVTGRRHTIEIWFAIQGRTLYMLSGGRDRADWVKNIMRNPETTVRIGAREIAGRGRIVEAAAEDALARRIVVEKYQPGHYEDLGSWGQTSLPVAVDLSV